jgi:predicted adenylyl cyclase CyaB
VFNLDIEVEVRSFISEDQYNKLLEFMQKNAKLIKKDNQITYYFSGDNDLRIQKNDFFSKIWLKSGNIHDPHRKEVEVKLDKEKFEQLEKLFLSLGYNIDIKWFRKRNLFDWNNISVAIDHTKGYGYIIELEKMSNEQEKEQVYEFLKNKLKELNINLTPKQDFDKKFNYYKENWKELTND